jgi:hypothetical protein
MGASRRFRRRVAGRSWGDQDMRSPEGRRCIDVMTPEARTVLDEALSAPEPYWNIKLVHHDPDGPCEAGCPDHDRRPGKAHAVHADFGYTVGLHERYGLPEVHAPAVPLVGPPGYSIDYESLGQVLNVAAARCITGEIGPGDRFDLTASRGGHRFHMTWTLGQPGPLEDCSAFQAHADAACIPIVWVVDNVECLEDARR